MDHETHRLVEIESKRLVSIAAHTSTSFNGLPVDIALVVRESFAGLRYYPELEDVSRGTFRQVSTAYEVDFPGHIPLEIHL
jgi:hypothetical protein